MRLTPFFILRQRHGPFERHVEVAEDAVAQVLEAVGGVVRVVVVASPVYDERVVGVDGVVELKHGMGSGISGVERDELVLV